MIDILMPRLSDTMTEGAISAWHKKPGDTIEPGDVLVEIETDKATMEHEAYESGVLAEILVAEGENVAIGAPIARLDDGTDEPAPPKPSAKDDRPELGQEVPDTLPAATRQPDAKPERRAATPLVRKLARERGIDLATVTGSGPGGRIVRADLDDATRRAPSAPLATDHPPQATAVDGEAIPFDAVRQAIAARVTQSALTIPTFTATASADAEALLALRADLNAALDGTGTKISVNDLLVRAAALALREHPGVNASYSSEGRGQTLVHSRVNINVAIASPAGLMMPVVTDADQAAVSAIAARVRALAEKAAARKIQPADLTGGTFSLSNLGMYGIEHFTAIINPPQGAILAVGGVGREVRIVDGRPEERRRLRYTLTADHRIIDGALAARYLATLTELIHHPHRIVA
ncbi:dihydrolipoamide acetyltransferase family protein [Actinophytocola gossypii]|uniref:Dihydrolipoamide acetyltransferase component of pyruvate dehydrogenase complex n=1 Tax=Actinophytocola gossypii TaxID=2812003 RepID=A0ABT2J3P7_9PSEU|nr:dihydrolipoamide acetyltransferase family protein [Actinophytocola gossypii]MCT2582229.1 2-oxo acid dehydrogenase subunit E2 [Actinophytocola gossypii]